MKYNVLGKTGIKVSEIGFGGEWLERHLEEESIELMKYAFKKGINIHAIVCFCSHVQEQFLSRIICIF